jgi:glycosyltransferase involved in cell wall biosynthesis
MALRTLMFGWEYPPHHSGGLGVACQGLVRGLMKNGVQVTLVLPHNQGLAEGDMDMRFPTDEMRELIEVESILQPYDTFESYEARLNITNLPRESGTLYGPDLGQAVHAFTEMSIAMTKDVQADVVHAHDWMTFEAGRRAAAYHGIPFIAQVHATELDRTNFNPDPWIAERERQGILAADQVIAVSQYTKNLLCTHYGVSPDKVTVVHNGHDQQVSNTQPILTAKYGNTKHPLVLFLGRMTVQKNPMQFIEVAKRVHDIRPEVQFVMAGDGGMLNELVDRACEVGLGESMIFTGKVQGKEIDALYKRADCFVMPSLSEPFGLVALEAIAHHTPVIVSKQSGVAEVLDHAFKVDFWDTDMMADCLLTILREEPLAEQLKSEAPRVLTRLTWKNQASKVSSLYRNMIQS